MLVVFGYACSEGVQLLGRGVWKMEEGSGRTSAIALKVRKSRELLVSESTMVGGTESSICLPKVTGRWQRIARARLLSTFGKLSW